MQIFLALMGLCLLVLGAQFMSGRWLSMLKADASKQTGIAVAYLCSSLAYCCYASHFN
ncbi:hypothetical protein [Lacticaseibacillus manihotivorans]|uniref:hypothetical protein n=1 Tax=Lacticaseibacillus manihotivorans TaxID=88233 RepID=UPI000AFACE29|nr:hypothetical protein [Lacticaseibacillus manihotivorans]